MPAEKLPTSALDITLRRLELCAYAVQEIHMQLQPPLQPEEKADLILSMEKLMAESIDLYQTIRYYVWGEEDEDSGPNHKDED